MAVAGPFGRLPPADGALGVENCQWAEYPDVRTETSWKDDPKGDRRASEKVEFSKTCRPH